LDVGRASANNDSPKRPDGKFAADQEIARRGAISYFAWPRLQLRQRQKEARVSHEIDRLEKFH
jgi:hypothetical protein